ncbi:MAG: YajQ family cyclic di-GMP-binding protein [Acidobacteria bacterium]|nr:MAG: YajQ family cyclic di-GMP-binding protein [Acidobacteriota bacterium]REK08418.1 MAG: YajQ family cyclic di-GMP-binding protein [Acidobacteriota bacterium]
MPSFDIVIEVDLQEVDNALNQARKEVGQRFDFRGSDSTIEWDGKSLITLKTDDDGRLPPLLDVVKSKLHKRGISIKNLEVGDPKPAGGMMHTQTVTLQVGVPKETAKEIAKLVKQSKMKVQAQIQEDQVRVSGKKRDDLQQAIQLIKGADLGLDFAYTNFRD